MLPTIIITGFLGSGKTTLLNRLLKHSACKNSLVVINEFGEIGIDHFTVSIPTENVRLLANGCMCCQTKGELADTLAEVSLKRDVGQLPPFDRVMIETTGLADPVPIVETLVNHAHLGRIYHLNRVIAVIDAVHFYSQLNNHDEARKQVAVADMLLLSKTDLVDPAELSVLDATVRQINPGAEMFRVSHGAVDPRQLLNDSVAASHDIKRWLGSVERGHDEQERHLHGQGISTFSASLEEPISGAGLATWLSMLASLKGPQLLRVKGLVNVGGEPFIIDIVQSVVHQPFKLDAWPTADKRSRIVFIGRALTREAIERTFSAFSMGDSLPHTARFDPEAYARFRTVADKFIELKDITPERRKTPLA